MHHTRLVCVRPPARPIIDISPSRLSQARYRMYFSVSFPTHRNGRFLKGPPATSNKSQRTESLVDPVIGGILASAAAVFVHAPVELLLLPFLLLLLRRFLLLLLLPERRAVVLGLERLELRSDCRKMAHVVVGMVIRHGCRLHWRSAHEPHGRCCLEPTAPITGRGVVGWRSGVVGLLSIGGGLLRAGWCFLLLLLLLWYLRMSNKMGWHRKVVLLLLLMRRRRQMRRKAMGGIPKGVVMKVGWNRYHWGMRGVIRQCGWNLLLLLESST